jgi:hypothetical protein
MKDIIIRLLKTLGIIIAAPFGIWTVYALLDGLAHTYAHAVAGYDGNLIAFVFGNMGASFVADQAHTAVLSFLFVGLVLSVGIVAVAACAIWKIWK